MIYVFDPYVCASCDLLRILEVTKNVHPTDFLEIFFSLYIIAFATLTPLNSPIIHFLAIYCYRNKLQSVFGNSCVLNLSRI